MQAHSILLDVQSNGNYEGVGRAWVLQHSHSASQVTLVRDLEAGAERFSATLPLHVLSSCEGYLERGDLVAVCGAPAGLAYVLGVLETVRPRRNLWRTSDGASVEVQDSAGGEEIRLSDAAGKLVCEYHPAEQKLVIHSAAGIDIRCGGDLVLDAGGDVRIQGVKGVLKFAKIETIAGSIWMRSRNLFQDITETWQLRTSRYRIFASMSALLHAKWIRSKAERTNSIQGDQVTLN